MEALPGSNGGGSMFGVQQYLVMKDITKGSVLEAKVHNVLRKKAVDWCAPSEIAMRNS